MHIYIYNINVYLYVYIYIYIHTYIYIYTCTQSVMRKTLVKIKKSIHLLAKKQEAYLACQVRERKSISATN